MSLAASEMAIESMGLFWSSLHKVPDSSDQLRLEEPINLGISAYAILLLLLDSRPTAMHCLDFLGMVVPKLFRYQA